MSLKHGKKQVAQIMAVLDQEHASMEDAALACLKEMEQVFAERAKFVVVGQLCGTKARRVIPPDDPEAIKLSLGWYSTEGDARSASDSLWTNPSSGDTFRRWVVNTYHGTPAEFHAERRAHYAALEAKQKEAGRERFFNQMEKMSREADERAQRWREMEEKAGQSWPCYGSRIKADQCRHDPRCK